MADTKQVKKMKLARKEFLNINLEDSLENLIANKIKCYSEKNIEKEIKHNSNIEIKKPD